MHRYKGSTRRDAIASYKRLLEMLDECGCELVSDYTGRNNSITIKIKEKYYTQKADDFIAKTYKSFVNMKVKTANNGDFINGVVGKDKNGFIYDITMSSGTNLTTNVAGYSKFKDLKGQRFGRLTVVELQPDRSNGHTFWLCRCDCSPSGNLKPVDSSDLQSGHTVSCGCRSRENVVKENKRKKSVAKAELEQLLDKVDGCLIDDYIDSKTHVNMSIKGVVFNSTPDNAKSIVKSLEDFILLINKEGDKVLSIVQRDGKKRGFILKIETYDGACVEYGRAHYDRFIRGRKSFYKKIKENGDKCYSPYLSGGEAVCIEFNRDFCRHEPQKVLPVKYNQGRRCPVCSQSKGEQVIQEYLSKENIVWQKQYKIITGDAVLDNKKYDLYLPTYNLIIEVHGFQHYEEVEFLKNQRNRSLLQEQKNDKIKLEYALNNNYRYMVVSHREGDINKTIARFKKQFKKFLEYYNSGKVNETKNKNRIY